MREPRHPPALAIVLIFAGAALLVPLPWLLEDRLLRALADFAHFPMFFLLGRLIVGRLRKGVLVGGLCVLALAAAVELLQSWTGRDSDFTDLRISAMGGLAGLWAADAFLSKSRIAARWANAVSAGFLCIVCYPTGSILLDRVWARREFPVLASFERPGELERWTFHGAEGRRASELVSDGQRALRVEMDGGVAYPGLFMAEFRRDWTAYTHLCFDLYWGGIEPRRFWLRVDDRREQPVYAERGQQSFTITSGWNHVCMELNTLLATPSGRRMAASKIARWGLFLDEAREGESFVLDHVRLSRE